MGQLVQLRQIVSGNNYEIIGETPQIRELIKKIENAAKQDIRILLQGQTGTGKELIARMIHEKSPWFSGPFVRINCAAIPDSLIENELFGYVKGAFTGADKDQPGKFERAGGGTLFLDEVDKFSLQAQEKLLRVLNEPGEYSRVGESQPRRVECRIISATNCDLRSKPDFLVDLYYRLNVYPVKVPSLRDRRDDIPRLVSGFLKEFGIRYNKTLIEVDPSAMKLLMDYDWPGNIRELRNVVDRCVIDAIGSVLVIADLPPELRDPNLKQMSRSVVSSEHEIGSSLADNLFDWASGRKSLDFERIMGSFEWKVYSEAHRRMGSWKEAGRLLGGIKESTLRSRVKELEDLEDPNDSAIAGG